MSDTESKRGNRPTALITGGSKGIGLALAKEFARHGYDLVLVARNRHELAQTARQIRSEYACRVHTCGLDLTAEHAPLELYQQLQAQGIQVDVLVNNAGRGNYGPFAERDPNSMLDMLRINILGLTAVTRLFLPDMIRRGRGRVLNVASLVAYYAGGPNWADYVASKHYVLAFTRGLAKELSGTGVSATALCPGPTATTFVGQAGVSDSHLYRWLPKVPPARIARAGYRAAMARRSAVVPGLLNRLLAFLGELHPRVVAQTVFAFLLHGGRTPGKETDRVAGRPKLSI